MPSLFSLSHRKWPFALALLAMLMLFIAPVISTSLEHRRAMANGEHHMAVHSADMMIDMDSMEISSSFHFLSPVGASLLDDIACGYCQLLLHIPLFIWFFIPLIWLIWCVSRAPPPAVIAPLLSQHDDAEALPRAPPVALFF